MLAEIRAVYERSYSNVLYEMVTPAGGAFSKKDKPDAHMKKNPQKNKDVSWKVLYDEKGQSKKGRG